MIQVATLAGGCFWCTEAVFQRLKGVKSVTSGYAGGDTTNTSYSDVSNGETGHAEAIQIHFDPSIISYEKLLEIFWATHDPTTLNRQGADEGTQYRSVIFYHDEGQKVAAEKSKQRQESSGQLNSVVTQIVPLTKFYRAEEYHQNYYNQNHTSGGYCSLVIAPKIQKLLDKFNSDVKEEYSRSI